jgi:sugar/nucleoside kinase (ribokinase family)
MTILCLGEAIVDLVCEEPVDAPEEAEAFVPHQGGALANVAVAAARAGAAASLLGGVGKDPWGRWLRQGLEEEGVHAGWVATVETTPTPVAFVTFNPALEPSFQVYGEAIGATMKAGGRFIDEAMEEAEAVVFGSNTLVGKVERELTIRARRQARDRGLPVLFDPNLRPNRWEEMDTAVSYCRELCDGTYLVRCTREEAALLTGSEDPASAASGLCALGARLGVVTMGAEGAVMRGAAEGEVDAPEVEVVAPLGAGDAFMGALAAGIGALGWDASRAVEALPAAAAAGARACTGWGAQS